MGARFLSDIFIYTYFQDMLQDIVNELKILLQNNNVYEIVLRNIRALYHFVPSCEENLNDIRYLIEKYNITEETCDIYIKVIEELGLEHHNAALRSKDILVLRKVSQDYYFNPKIVEQCNNSILSLLESND